MYIIVWQDEFEHIIIDTHAPVFDDYYLAVDYVSRKNEKFAESSYYHKRWIYEVK